MEFFRIIRGIGFAVLLLAACNGHSRQAPPAADASQRGDAGQAAKEVWTCPMHPEIFRDKPGTCPICGMDLVRKESHAARLADIRLDDLLQPANGFVVSAVPVTAIRNETMPLEMAVLGRAGYDTRLVNTISARVSGRVEKAYVRYRYQHVDKGDRIMDIYSPELLTGEQELLFLLKNDPDNIVLINEAKQKLLLLGVSDKQLQDIIASGRPSPTIAVYSNYNGLIREAGNAMPDASGGVGMDATVLVTSELPVKEGMYIEKGQTVFQVFGTDRSWVLLNLFPGQERTVHLGDAVRVAPETGPDKDFRGKIDFVEPFYRSGEKTVTARVYFDNRKLQLPVGSPVRATIFGRAVPGEWLPGSAVLSLGLDRIVFVREDGGFRAQKVVTGISVKDKVQVLSGLSPADSVAANAQYLMDSESFIKVNEKR